MEFRMVRIHPSHFNKTAIIQWTVAPEFKAAEFYIYKKHDGGATWKLLNTVPAFGTTYADTDFYIPNKEQQPAYKILGILGTKEIESPEIAVLPTPNRKAFGIAQNIIRAKYLQARQDGIPVLYYPAVKNGKMSASLDQVTGQRITAACGDNGDYGTYYADGYYPPFITYVRFLNMRRYKATITDQGKFDQESPDVEFLAYPPIRPGDLVVDVATDRRWLVNDTIQIESVQSVIPVAQKCTMALQNTSRELYAVPIPDNYEEMLNKLIGIQ